MLGAAKLHWNTSESFIITSDWTDKADTLRSLQLAANRWMNKCRGASWLFEPWRLSPETRGWWTSGDTEAQHTHMWWGIQSVPDLKATLQIWEDLNILTLKSDGSEQHQLFLIPVTSSAKPKVSVWSVISRSSSSHQGKPAPRVRMRPGSAHFTQDASGVTCLDSQNALRPDGGKVWPDSGGIPVSSVCEWTWMILGGKAAV